MKRADVIENNIQPGDVIVALSSTGQATYEKKYNGGMGSNGLTSARHDVFNKSYASNYPESFDPAIPYDLVFSGSCSLTGKTEVNGVNAGQLVLSPTRTYAPVIKDIIHEMRPLIHGIIHCSGGAQTKVLHFANNVHIIKDNLFPTPPLFRLIQRESSTDWQEMYKVFNMGHRMELYVDPNQAQRIIEISQSYGIDVRIAGSVHAFNGKKLTIKSAHGTFVY
jgi:phosphoribosylformylglycinamidine cyclo-ligase